jgi:hypothetical protein
MNRIRPKQPRFRVQPSRTSTFAKKCCEGMAGDAKDRHHVEPRGGGQHGDALARVENWTGGLLSVESNSHVPEIFGNECGAKAASSVKKIEQAIAAAKHMVAFERTGRLAAESAGSCGCHLSPRSQDQEGLPATVWPPLAVGSSLRYPR